MLMFTVPGEPVPKARPRVTGARAYTPARTRQHERLIWVHALQAGVRPVALGPVGMTIDFWLTRPDRSDLDNLAKTVLDALNGTAYADDRQVVELHLFKHHELVAPRTNVAIRPLGERK
jgi:crossover junction endodeoxyribonuclease RusA